MKGEWMISTYKCIRVKNEKKPLKSRCGKPLNKNSILCDKCMADARRGKIPVLMCNDVTQMFGVKFKNQVFAYIDLSKDAKKPDSNNQVDMKVAEFRKKLFHELKFLKIKELESFCGDIGLKNLEEIKVKSGKDEYRYRYFLSTFIVERLAVKGLKDKSKT